MKHELASYVPVARALEALLHPLAEIVLHDLAKQKIVAIYNSFSKRKVGDDSLLEKEIQIQSLPDFYTPYYKTNWDGKKLKSTSITIKDAQGKPVGLLCINIEIQAFEEMRGLLGRILHFGAPADLPKELFCEDWREKISTFVHAYLKRLGKQSNSLSKDERKDLVKKLHQEGAFKAKNAATFVGDILGISRATVYNYLNEKER